MEYTEQATTKADLALINRFTLRELAEDDVFTFQAKVIDSEPTSNKRIWSKEWQAEAVKRKLYDGVPLLVNHENDQTVKIGTAYSADFKDGATYTKFFVPLDSAGKLAREAIQNGRLRNVSVSANAERTEQAGENTRILPSPTDRVLEVSFVAVGGCKSCATVPASETSTCPTPVTERAPTEPNPLWEWAQEEFSKAQAEFVRAAAFVLGSSIHRETYQKLAADTDPRILRTLTQDFSRAYHEQNKALPKEQRSSNGAKRIKQIMEDIQTQRGK